jgi:radical SAM protein with 4Fe4S-binding SPASM domain
LSKYIDALHSGFAIGFRNVQFIGGEPTNYRELPQLIFEAYLAGYKRIEVFTNLHRMPQPILDALVKTNSRVATSIYSACPETHDKVTQVGGSFGRTMHNLRRIVGASVPVRVGFIEMDVNRGQFDETRQMLAEIGVPNVGHDAVRGFGRATINDRGMENLCGACAGQTACVSHDGTVYPCVMARAWPLGSVLEQPLAEILASNRALDVRQAIADSTAHVRADCHPNTCYPHQGPCSPVHPNPPTCHPY